MSLGYFAFANEVTVRQMRNQGRDVVDGVLAGERLTDTRVGQRLAELRPRHRRALDTGSSRFRSGRWGEGPRLNARGPPESALTASGELEDLCGS